MGNTTYEQPLIHARHGQSVPPVMMPLMLMTAGVGEVVGQISV